MLQTPVFQKNIARKYGGSFLFLRSSSYICNDPQNLSLQYKHNTNDVSEHGLEWKQPFLAGFHQNASFNTQNWVSSRDASVTEEKGVWIPATEFLHMIESVEGRPKDAAISWAAVFGSKWEVSFPAPTTASCSDDPERETVLQKINDSCRTFLYIREKKLNSNLGPDII